MCTGLGLGPSRARLADSDLPVADSLGHRGGAVAAAVYLVEVEIVLRLLQLEFLALLLADTQQQIIKYVVVPVGDQQRSQCPTRPTQRKGPLDTLQGMWDAQLVKAPAAKPEDLSSSPRREDSEN